MQLLNTKEVINTNLCICSGFISKWIHVLLLMLNFGFKRTIYVKMISFYRFLRFCILDYNSSLRIPLVYKTWMGNWSYHHCIKSSL